MCAVYIYTVGCDHMRQVLIASIAYNVDFVARKFCCPSCFCYFFQFFSLTHSVVLLLLLFPVLICAFSLLSLFLLMFFLNLNAFFTHCLVPQ